MKLIKSFRIFQIFAMLHLASCDTDYCSFNLCSGLSHVGCGNSGDFDSSCPSDRKILDLSISDIQLILDDHNNLRNKIAGGQEIGFSEAARMSTMVWNEELAKLAELNVKTCKFQHDQCRNTEKFPYAGQNIALSQISDVFDTLTDLINNSIQNWYSEVSDATQADIDSYKSDPAKKIGHFTQIVNDLSNEVGCAAVQFTSSDGWKTSIFACNYARTNIMDYPIYTSGSAASKCSSGPNKDYKALCSLDEVVDANSV